MYFVARRSFTPNIILGIKAYILCGVVVWVSIVASEMPHRTSSVLLHEVVFPIAISRLSSLLFREQYGCPSILIAWFDDKVLLSPLFPELGPARRTTRPARLGKK